MKTIGENLHKESPWEEAITSPGGIWSQPFHAQIYFVTSLKKALTQSNSYRYMPTHNGLKGVLKVTMEGLPGVLGNKGTRPFIFREQGISSNNF